MSKGERGGWEWAKAYEWRIRNSKPLVCEAVMCQQVAKWRQNVLLLTAASENAV